MSLPEKTGSPSLLTCDSLQSTRSLQITLGPAKCGGPLMIQCDVILLSSLYENVEVLSEQLQFRHWVHEPSLPGGAPDAPLPLSLPTSESCWAGDCTTTYHPCSSSMTQSPITVLLQHTALFMEVEEICTHTHTHHGNQFSKSVQTFQTVLSPVHQRTEPLWKNKLGHLPFLLLAGFWWWLRGVNLLSDVCVPQIKTSCFILSHELHGFLLRSWNEVYQAAQFTGWA